MREIRSRATRAAAALRRLASAAPALSPRRGQQQAQQILERIADGFVAVDKNWRFTYVNAAAARQMGRSAEQMLGKHVWTEVPEGSRAEFERGYRQAMTEQRPIVLESYYAPLGTWYESRLYPSPEGLSIYFQDITQRKRAEAALQESEARTQLLVRWSNIGLWDWDLRSDEVHFSPVWKRQLGYAAHELSNHRDEWISRLHPDDREPTLKAAKEYAEGRRAEYELECRLRHKDGSWRWILARAELQRDAGGQPVHLMGCHVDITERKQMRAELRALSHRLLGVQEAERRQVAMELHDDVGQTLTAAKIALQSLQHAPDAVPLAPKLDESVGLIGRALEQVRSLSRELHPPMLDDLGLIPALRWMADEQASRAGLRLQFVSGPLDARPAAAVEIACFRVAQEALTNIVKHARAENVRVDVRTAEGLLHLRISDDGIGFDVGAAREKAARGATLGLISIEERAALAGGRVEWCSAPGEGSIVLAWMPLGGVATSNRQVLHQAPPTP